MSLRRALLAAGHRGFGLKASSAKIRALRRPHELYDTLLHTIQSAQHRVSLAALYLGTGEHERRLISALEHAMATKPQLEVQVVVDGRRARRRNKEGRSTLSMVEPLVRRFPDRFRMGLVTMPAAARAAQLPAPLDEVAGVFHLKAFVADDEVMISGANLSTDYFVDRQDRCICLSHPPVAGFYHDLLTTMRGGCRGNSEHHAGGSSSSSSNSRGHSSDDVISDAVAQPHWKAPLMDMLRQTGRLDARGLSGGEAKDEERGKVEGDADGDVDTWIFPTLQCAPIGVEQDHQITRLVLQHCPPNAQVRLASAYFNPPEALASDLARCAGTHLRLLTAHTSSHGFQHARGLMAAVPSCYDLLTQRFTLWLRSQRKVGTHWAFAFYRRQNWTFHAKGLWLFGLGSIPHRFTELDMDVQFTLNRDDPNAEERALTIVGSSNFGMRSTQRDLESQLVRVPTHPLSPLSTFLRPELDV